MNLLAVPGQITRSLSMRHYPAEAIALWPITLATVPTRPALRTSWSIELHSKPNLHPPSGTYNEPTKVTLVDETPGAVISYSIAGRLPAMIYSGPFYVNDLFGSDPGYIVSANGSPPPTPIRARFGSS